MNDVWKGTAATILAAIFAGQLGCGGSTAADLTKAAANVQNTAASVQQVVEETATKAAGLTTGSVELDVNGPLKTDRCSAWFTPPSGDRPAVLQLTTTETLDADPKFTEYPSVYVWASVPVAGAQELQVGKTVQGQLMIRREPLREIWQNEMLQPVTVTITAVDSWSIECEVKDAELKRLDADGKVKVAGKFRAVWK